MPDKIEALQFALMLQSGMPSVEAIRYFAPPVISPNDLAAMHEKWMGSREVKAAIVELQGQPWQDLTIEDRIRLAIDKHYSEMAYFLYSRNYVELVGTEKQKADTCRQALEAKLAGMAGKLDALTQFFADVSAGKVKLAGGVPLAPIPARAS